MKTLTLIGAVLVALSQPIVCAYMSYVYIKYHNTMLMYDFILEYKEVHVYILLSTLVSFYLVKISDRL